MKTTPTTVDRVQDEAKEREKTKPSWGSMRMV